MAEIQQQRRRFATSIFPEITDRGMDTVKFLDASRSIVSIIDGFGKLFFPVVYDMNGNIKKLMDTYKLNPEKYTYLNDMVLAEKMKSGSNTMDSLLWLKRALTMLHQFFFFIVADTNKNDNLQAFLRKAYQNVLEKYHSWPIKQLFNAICAKCPTRSEVLGKNLEEEASLQDLNKVLESLQNHITEIDKFYDSS